MKIRRRIKERRKTRKYKRKTKKKYVGGVLKDKTPTQFGSRKRVVTDSDEDNEVGKDGANEVGKELNSNAFNKYLEKQYANLSESITKYNELVPPADNLAGRMDKLIKQDYTTFGCNLMPYEIYFTNFEIYIKDLRHKYIKVRDSFIVKHGIKINENIGYIEFIQLIHNEADRNIFIHMYDVQTKLVDLAYAYRRYQLGFCKLSNYPAYHEYTDYSDNKSDIYPYLGGRKSKKRTAKSSK
jgi:hypothetical protein